MAQHRLYNLIEHVAGTENRYLFMDVLEGTMQARSQLAPDSTEWFAWLARLGSFHFQGKHGHFTARQERKQRGDTYWYFRTLRAAGMVVAAFEEPEPTEEFLASSEQGSWIAEIPLHCVLEAWKVRGVLLY